MVADPEVPRTAVTFGLRVDPTGTHLSSTLKLEELRRLLAVVDELASGDDYRQAIIDANALGKPTASSRRITYDRLRELYGLDRDFLLFKALRSLWSADERVLMPIGDSSFYVTPSGEGALTEDLSPYQSTLFLDALSNGAPRISAEAIGYLALALQCLFGIPVAAVALIRVAMESELDDLIDELVDSATPQGATLKKLDDRNVSVRLGALCGLLQSRSLLGNDEIVAFRAHADICRIRGNRVVHPEGTLPLVDALEVQAVMFAFKEFAEIASMLKGRLSAATHG